MPRSTIEISLAENIAAAVHRAFIAEFEATRRMPRHTPSFNASNAMTYVEKGATKLPLQAAAHSGASSAATQRAASSATTAPSTTAALPSLGAEAQATAPTHPGAPVATPASTAQPQSSTSDIVERVRADLVAAYEGVPVSPARLAFRLKSDHDLVDAALTYLVRRREARALGVKGKIGYIPIRNTP